MNKKGNSMTAVDRDETVQYGAVADLNSPSKLLSICMSGRDDDYMLDFRYRITTTINHLARSIKNLRQQDKVEILVTDWGSHVPMSQTLELSPEVAEVCRFIYVSPDVIRATQEGKDDFHAPRAFNVAIRRAKGQFIMLYNADTLIQEYPFAQVLRLLNGEIPLPVSVERTYFMMPRIDVPWQFLQRHPNLEQWDRYLLLSAKSTPLEPTTFSSFGGAGALLTSRFLWKALRGGDERYSGWGWTDNDLGMRVSINYPWLSLSTYGVFLHHMGHKPHSGRRQHAWNNPNPWHYNPVLHVNDKDWGLGGYELEKQAPQIMSSSELSGCRAKQHIVSEPSESWPQSFEEIVSELTSNMSIKHIEQICMFYLNEGLGLNLEDINALFFCSGMPVIIIPADILNLQADGLGPWTW
jgi:hypothetical protein